VPLSSRGLMSAFVINFTLAISAFVIPMILGKGKILFFSNLIYNRFGETANYPSGSAIAVELLLLSLALIYGLQLLVPQRLERV
jgi:ABC-type spermidine/putrescine transport system permease subunit I